MHLAVHSFAVALSATNAQGKAFGQSHSGTVHGTLVSGSSSDNRNDSGRDTSIIGSWNQIKSSTGQCHLHSSLDAVSTIAVIFEGIVLPGAGVALLTGSPQVCVNGQPVNGGTDGACPSPSPSTQ